MCHVVSFSAEVFVLLVADFKTSHYKIPWNQNIHTHTVGTERSKLSWGWSDLFSVDKWEHYKRQDIFMAHGKEKMLHYVLFRSEIVNTSGTFTWERVSEQGLSVNEWAGEHTCYLIQENYNLFDTLYWFVKNIFKIKFPRSM